ncbi:MAG: ECF transporter S component [Symbiobacteriaceae bacterium]|nr:MAG: thiamine ABC transporter permease [Bacillota bacterium]
MSVISPRPSRSLRFSEIVMLAFVGVACSALYMVWWQPYEMVSAVHPALGEAVTGIWYIASIVAAYIIQKPWVAFWAELLAAAGELLLGGPGVLQLLAYGGLQGLGAEAAFALFRYRRFDAPVLALAGVLAALTSIPLDAAFGYLTLTPGTLAIALTVRLLSGAVLAGLAGKAIVDGLVRTGVLNAYAVVRRRRDSDASMAG